MANCSIFGSFPGQQKNHTRRVVPHRLAKEFQISMETLTAALRENTKPTTARREGLEFSLLAEVDRLSDKQLEALIIVARTYQ